MSDTKMNPCRKFACVVKVSVLLGWKKNKRGIITKT